MRLIHSTRQWQSHVAVNSLDVLQLQSKASFESGFQSLDIRFFTLIKHGCVSPKRTVGHMSGPLHVANASRSIEIKPPHPPKILLHLEDYFWLVSNPNTSILRGERSARRRNRSSIRHGVKDTKEGQGALTPRQATLTTGPSWVIVVHLC